LTKADIKDAYRMLPVHPQDQHLLRKGSIYIDQSLPFGLRSAPKIFSAVANAIQWILYHKDLHRTLHYLDNSVMVTSTKILEVSQKQSLISTWEKLGVPMEVAKLEGPAQCMKFLGIEFDTVSLQLRLPANKLQCLKAELASCILRATLFKKELRKKPSWATTVFH